MTETYVFQPETQTHVEGIYLSDGTIVGGFVNSGTIRRNIKFIYTNLEKHESRKYKTYIFFLTLNKKDFKK